MPDGYLKQIRPAPFRNNLPNVLTLLSLCAGLMALKFSLDSQWQIATGAILVAALIDSVDGMLARALNTPTRFGAQLDSLADLVSFGVAPAFLVYLWALDGAGIGWALVLAYAVCCALRLARFNTTLDDPDRPIWKTKYLIGVPAPMGAITALLPLLLNFTTGAAWLQSTAACAFAIIAASLLMISRWPTFSPRRIGVDQDNILLVMAGLAVFVALLATYLWPTVSLIAVVYLASVPYSRYEFKKREQEAAENNHHIIEEPAERSRY